MKKLWYNGTIYTMQHEQHTVEAVLVEDDRIVALGTCKALQQQADQLINLQGATMFPGFVDSHLHMISYGQRLLRLDLESAKSSKEMLQMLAQTAKKLQNNEWLFAESFNENNFTDKTIPTIEQLDAIYDGPMIITRVCHHVNLVNSKALAMARIDANTPNPIGGQIGRHPDGSPNGLLYEKATDLITSILPREGEAYIHSLERELQLTVDTMLSMGLTGGHTEEMAYYGAFENPYTAYMHVVGSKKNFRVNLLRHHTVFEDMITANLPYAEPFVMPGAMKIFADGSLGGSTAALQEPYSDNATSKGMLIHSDKQMEEYVKLARAHGEAIAVHMIGDAAAKQVVDLIEKYPVPRGKRDRLIHLCVIDEELLARIQKLPVVVDVQPPFVPSDFPWVVDRLGEKRLQYAYAWKKFLNAGLLCAGGTDAPIEDIDPLLSIYTAVERKWPNDRHNGYMPEEKLTRYEAIHMYTVGSAQAICREHEFGQIKEGYYADFSVFDRDLFEGPSEQLIEAKAIQTVVGGNIVYRR